MYSENYINALTLIQISYHTAEMAEGVGGALKYFWTLVNSGEQKECRGETKL